MVDLPDMLSRGERARLFPVLADTSKEGRTLSIFLACLQNVNELGRGLLSGLGVRIGVRSRIETFTEVVLQKSNGKDAFRPDGLIVVTNGSNRWTALVEAKVGASDLSTEQVEAYLELAKLNGVDALITLSNQFAPLPSHHPVNVGAVARRRAALFHWSWMYVLTQSTLLLSNEDVADRDQRVILQEMTRFLLHPSAGVKGFDQMPAAWSDLVGHVQAGGAISAGSSDAKEVVGAWHQEVSDLCLTLSRQLGTDVDIRIPRAHLTDPSQRQKADLAKLAGEARLHATLIVPAAAAPIEVCADLEKRSVMFSMWLRAPDDRKGTKARVTWLLRQIPAVDVDRIYVRMFWPGRTAYTQRSLKALRENPDLAGADRAGQAVLSFEVMLVKDLGAKFGQRKTFIGELESAAPEFYEKVGENLKAWQARAPKLRDEKADPGDVGTEALREEMEIEALAREN